MWYWNRSVASDAALSEEEIADMVWAYYWKNIPEEELVSEDESLITSVIPMGDGIAVTKRR